MSGQSETFRERDVLAVVLREHMEEAVPVTAEGWQQDAESILAALAERGLVLVHGARALVAVCQPGHCRACGLPLPPPRGHGRPKEFCDRACQLRAWRARGGGR